MRKSKIYMVVMIIACALIVGLVAGLIATAIKRNQGGGSADITITADGAIYDDEGNVFESGEVYAMPASITFTSLASTATTAQSVTVKATITPSNADNTKVTWESSDSAVTVTPSATDSRVATITRISDIYDGSVTITCRSAEKPEIYATCKVDQLISGSALVFDGSISGNPTSLMFGQSYTVNGNFTTQSPSVPGTLFGDTENVYWSLNLTSDFMDKIDEYLGNTDYTFNGNDGTFDTNGVTATLFDSSYECFSATNEPWDEESFNHAFKLAMDDLSEHCTVTIWGDYTYNGKTYKSGFIEIPMAFSKEGIWVSVEGIELDENQIVFAE